MKKIKINELLELSKLISRCNNDKDLKNPLTIITSIRLTKSINAGIKKHFEEQEQLFNRFDVKATKNENGTIFKWDDKPSEEIDKINFALNEINNFEHKIDYLNSIDEEDFVIYTRGLNNSEVLFLYDYLVKEK